MKKIIHFLPIITICAIAISCSSNVIHDEYLDIDEGIWHVDSLAAFDFNIEDTTTRYNIAYNVRYAAQYPYYNLYVTYYLEDSSENIIASELQNLILFDKKTGTPLGDGLGDLFDREITVFEDYKFKSAGKHTLKIKQFMRMEELPGILSFGLQLSKPENK